jgi:hypothetical protein
MIQEHSQLFLGMKLPLSSFFPLLPSGEVSRCHCCFATAVPLLPPLLREMQWIFLLGYHCYLNSKCSFSCCHCYHHYLDSGSSCYHCYHHYYLKSGFLLLPLLPPLPREQLLLLLLPPLPPQEPFSPATTATTATSRAVSPATTATSRATAVWPWLPLVRLLQYLV